MSGDRRALVAGWFSFNETIATVGDLSGRDVTERWLQQAGWSTDIALATYMGDGVDWRTVDPDSYDLLVFSTGPLIEDAYLDALLSRFKRCERWAVNVSVIDDSMRDHFTRVWARDDGGVVTPDLAFAGEVDPPSLVAVAWAPGQAEYPNGRHDAVAGAVRSWLALRRLPSVDVEMDMFVGPRYPRSHRQVDAVLARAEAVVSMRLHGLVFGLRAGRPVIALDPVAGGGKVAAQARAVDWPCVLLPEQLDVDNLDLALEWCRSSAAPPAVATSLQAGRRAVTALGSEFARALDAID